jgi:hypothetical protein
VGGVIPPNDFYLPSLRVEEGGGGSAPCGFETESLTLTVSGRRSSSPCSLLAASPSTSSRSSSLEATSCLWEAATLLLLPAGRILGHVTYVCIAGCLHAHLFPLVYVSASIFPSTFPFDCLIFLPAHSLCLSSLPVIVFFLSAYIACPSFVILPAYTLPVLVLLSCLSIHCLS